MVAKGDHPAFLGGLGRLFFRGFKWLLVLGSVKAAPSKGWQMVPKGCLYISGQIIATSHDLTPHGRVVGEPCLKWPYFSEIQVGEIL